MADCARLSKELDRVSDCAVAATRPVQPVDTGPSRQGPLATPRSERKAVAYARSPLATLALFYRCIPEQGASEQDRRRLPRRHVWRHRPVHSILIYCTVFCLFRQ